MENSREKKDHITKKENLDSKNLSKKDKQESQQEIMKNDIIREENINRNNSLEKNDQETSKRDSHNNINDLVKVKNNYLDNQDNRDNKEQNSKSSTKYVNFKPKNIGNNDDIDNVKNNNISKTKNIIIENITNENKIKKEDYSKTATVNYIVQNKCLSVFVDIKPFLIKLFSQIIILYLAIVGWLNYQNAVSLYSDFLTLLNDPLIVNATIAGSNFNCSSIGFEDITPAIFPAISEGCQCDGHILTDFDCDYIKSRYLNGQQFDPNSQACSQYDNPAPLGRRLQSKYKENFDLFNKELMRNNTDDINSATSVNDFFSYINYLNDNNYNITETIKNISYIPIALNRNSTFSYIRSNNSSSYLRKKDDSQNKNRFLADESSIPDPDYYPSTLTDDYQYPGFGEYDKEGVLKNLTYDIEKFNVSLIDGKITPVNNKGIPLDLVKAEAYPTSCSCFRHIPPKTEKTISLWEDGAKICVKKDPSLSTIKYLQSIDSFRDCKISNKCQKYFCKEDNSTCPLIDLWITDYNATTGQDLNNPVIITSTDNIQEKLYGEDYMNNVYLPMIGLKIGLQGSCNDKGNIKPGLDFMLLNNFQCSSSQVDDPIAYSTITDILNINGGIYDEYVKDIPILKRKISNTTMFVMESSHVFFRKALTCFMRRNDTALMNQLYSTYSFPASGNSFLYKLQAILYSFTSIDTYFRFEDHLQKYVLIVNAVVLLFSLISILIKTYTSMLSTENNCLNNYIRVTIYILFGIDLSSAIVGGIAYIRMKKIVNTVEALAAVGCLDDYSISRLYVYTGNLDQTAELNFQVFIVIIFKIAFSIFSFVFYFLALRRKLSAMTINKIFYETISDGEPWDDDGIKVADRQVLDDDQEPNNNNEINDNNNAKRK